MPLSSMAIYDTTLYKRLLPENKNITALVWIYQFMGHERMCETPPYLELSKTNTHNICTLTTVTTIIAPQHYQKV